MGKTAIVYYSMSENTDYAAKKIAGITGADLIRISPEKAYPDSGMKKFIWGGKSALMGDTPKLEPYEFNADEYDCIIFGSPVWASCFTPPIRTFIKENKEKITGKKIAAFFCFSGGGADKAAEKLKAFVGADSFSAYISLIDPKNKETDETEKKIRDFSKAVSG